MAHEINNPNLFIMSGASILKDVLLDLLPYLEQSAKKNLSFGGLSVGELNLELPEVVRGIAEGSRRIAAIIDDLRNFVLLRPQGVFTSVSINEVLRATIALIHHQIVKKTTKFTTSIPVEIVPVSGDRNQLQQVLTNLILNAVESLPSTDSSVRVTVRQETGGLPVVVEVIDEGTGMTPETLARARDNFFTTKGISGGLGLGLAITDTIVKRHGGVFELESEPGIGTCARVRLPLDAEASGGKRGGRS